MRFQTRLCLVLGILFTSHALAFNLPRPEAAPGGIAVVNLGISTSTTNGKTPVVSYNKQRIMVADNKGTWYGIVGIPLTAKAGKHRLTIKGQRKAINFTVEPKKYAEQHITIKDKRKVNPTEEDMKRIRREKKRINRALAHWEEKENVETGFILPVTGELSSPFGLRRFFNEQPRKPHSGIDIAAPEGEPIVAPASGKVIETGDFFFNGNSVFIDHGQGLVTMYTHMNIIKVKPGDQVKQGDIIGSVGQSGRATGPHLHWGVSLNNARVDPRLFFENFDLSINSENKM
ncbi:peptidoglycan DD-metalloendopeptidase family protein [Kaarinaea lacus]